MAGLGSGRGHRKRLQASQQRRAQRLLAIFTEYRRTNEQSAELYQRVLNAKERVIAAQSRELGALREVVDVQAKRIETLRALADIAHTGKAPVLS